ncbi:hypothetical protein [Rudanella lutea]|uniref:hypothetical protein n=1 Tax=Rudanella lutea TaxID=451374 RepID=UPI000374034C|nr:hypothetical protein [Rudanella lutea]
MNKGLFAGLLLGLSVGLVAFTLPTRSLLPTRTSTTTDSLQLDKETGLVIDDRLTLVKGQCTACHSSKLILQSQLTRDGWRQKIRWMQRTQKLWDLGESEPVILDYLTRYYGPKERPFDGRRLPLPKPQWGI